ncbi:MAG TPA: NAD-dependent succinate-semialdehyde dehydrogenase [Ferruginibacter sp.]|nr:NAD-dependent succinate-semialdehyde dehydrogenase [Ferruginibacter sp.]HMP19934.1 NAD-dependent succinate-semialdehyde dehydrogenase [Ferruginibacter sp.]
MPKVFTSIFPYTQEPVAEYPLMNDAAINQSVQAAEKAFTQWRQYSFAQRAKVLNRTAEILRNTKEALASLITLEMGKTTTEALAEIEKCALVCNYYATHAEAFLKDEIQQTGFYKSLLHYQPIGAVLGIMPWNFPFWQVFRYAVPTLMAGNVTLLKHAPNVCGCAKKIETIFLEAGAPAGVFQTIIADVDVVPKLLEQNIVQALTLTGSEQAGSAAASIAGRHIKKTVLELGGSDALIVLPDADLQKAANTALQSRMQNAGQSCIAAKRFIVHQAAINEFMQHLLSTVKKYQQGNPFDTHINLGPMARTDLAKKLEQQLQQSVQQGAQLVYGGEFIGCNVSPVVLLNVKPGMPAFDEETFGPLAAITVVQTENEAIALANQSRYGLGAAIWTKDIDRAMFLARQIQSGAVFINSTVRSMPELPFGGTKKSGYGRELGRQGLLEFVHTQTIAADI